MTNSPKYPIYVISKGRADSALTAKFLIRDNVPFHIVVEPQEKEVYSSVVGESRVLVLPFSNLGLGSIPARNWVWEHSIANGYEKHWILDDNIRQMYYRYKAMRFPCNSSYAFKALEHFIDRYENLAIAGMNYKMFLPNGTKHKPFTLNHRVYSTLLIDNKIPYRWRGRYNEDTDLCLQVLASGLCTALWNVFLIDKIATMKMKGGNSAELYVGDGRLKMSRSLERIWPGIVETKRRYKRPQHYVNWNRFTTQLKLKQGVPVEDFNLENYGMTMNQIKPQVKSDLLRQMLKDNKHA